MMEDLNQTNFEFSSSKNQDCPLFFGPYCPFSSTMEVIFLMGKFCVTLVLLWYVCFDEFLMNSLRNFLTHLFDEFF